MRSVIALIGLTLCFAVTGASGADAKTYTEGAVTELSFIKLKPGKFDDYMKYLVRQLEAPRATDPDLDLNW